MHVRKGDAAIPPRRLEARRYLDSSLLVIDEVGFRPLDRQEANLFFRLVSGRYEKGSIILTSNKHVRDWPEIFAGDGESYLACALGHQACRLGISTRYYRVSRLLVLDDTGAWLGWQAKAPRSARSPRRPLRPASSPPSSPSSTGMTSSATPRSGTPSSTPSWQRPPHHSQLRLHEATVRLVPGRYAPLSTTPDRSLSITPSGSPLRPGRLRSESVDSFVGNRL